MAKKKSESGSSAEPDFEHSLQKLQETVRELESGSLTLTDSLARYEAGVKHLKQCLKLLEQTEQRVRQLIEVDAEGNAVLVDFEHSGSAQTRSAGRSGRGAKSGGAAAEKNPLWQAPDQTDDEGDEGDDEWN